ncbi:MAG: pre-peptidase C-terminal domain-containing protein, partial [Planctomycetaceae bacterium]
MEDAVHDDSSVEWGAAAIGTMVGQIAAASTLYPLSSVPVLNSLPSAVAQLYLDFNGYFAADFGNVTIPAHDLDGDPNTFNDAELADMEAIWSVVAEDYAPFNINVTTVEPPVLAAVPPGDAANGIALRLAIGGTSDLIGQNAAGYAASIGGFTTSAPNLGFVFTGNKSWSPATSGLIASHEAGHVLGLWHVNPVPGSLINKWQPIMQGSVISNFNGVWTNYTLSGTTDVYQDDMAVLSGPTNGFGYRPDDHTNSPATATPLTQAGDTWIGAGVISTNSDVDLFSFNVAANDTYSIKVNGQAISANLDAAIELRNAANQVIATVDPQNSQNAELRAGLTPGTYYVAVKSNGVYGWVGQYDVLIDTPPAGITVTPSSPTLTTGEEGRQASVSIALQTQPTADVTISVSSTNTAAGTVSTANVVFTAANWDVPQVVTVTGADDTVVGNDTAYDIVLGAAVSSDLEYNGLDTSDLAVVNVDNDEAGQLYRADSLADRIARSGLDGAPAETVVDLPAAFGSGVNYGPGGLDVDLVGGKVYWIDFTTLTIQRASLDGSNAELLHTFPSGAFPRDIAVDHASGKMYWGDLASTARKLQRANLDGSQVEDLVTGTGVNGVALDPSAGKVYWADGTVDRAIKRSNLDGSNVEVLWSGGASSTPTALDLDLVGGKLYWSDTTADVIRRSNLDGTDVEVVIDTTAYLDDSYVVGNSSPSSAVNGLSVDPSTGKIYWLDYGPARMYRANLDGSLIAELAPIPQTFNLKGLEVVHLPPGISVTGQSGLTTNEDGTSAAFHVALTTAPSGTVTVPVSLTDGTEGSVSTSSLVFTPENWNEPQVVTVTGLSDGWLDGDVSYAVVLGTSTSSDPVYDGIDPSDVNV